MTGHLRLLPPLEQDRIAGWLISAAGALLLLGLFGRRLWHGPR